MEPLLKSINSEIESSGSRLFNALTSLSLQNLILQDYRLLLIFSLIVDIACGLFNILDSIMYIEKIYGAFAIVGTFLTITTAIIMLILICYPTKRFSISACVLSFLAMAFTCIQYAVFSITTRSVNPIALFIELLVVIVQTLPIFTTYSFWFYLMYNYDRTSDLGSLNSSISKKSPSESFDQPFSLTEMDLNVKLILKNEDDIDMNDNKNILVDNPIR
jgi:hypothetical protein